MKTLLLVEDHPVVAALEQRQLSQRGYNVIHVSTGERAVDEMRKNFPAIDLILMDIDLGPSMDGIEAAQTITASCDVPIIFLSSHFEREIVDRAEKISSYGYVLKSAGIVALNAAITNAFRLHDEFLELKNRQAAKDSAPSPLT